tara:strand:+ start:62 stop:463 length:402 start_codon:yes stop_codon:yes gene_type:complete
MAITRGYKALVKQAAQEITRLSVEQARDLIDDDNVVLVDIRDIRELNKSGRIPGAVHAPRGMLEFWIDPESPYHREIFAQDKRFVFFCAAGLRSALATKTAQDMGLAPVADVIGGFSAWLEAGAPIEPPAARD